MTGTPMTSTLSRELGRRHQYCLFPHLHAEEQPRPSMNSFGDSSRRLAGHTVARFDHTDSATGKDRYSNSAPPMGSIESLASGSGRRMHDRRRNRTAAPHRVQPAG